MNRNMSYANHSRRILGLPGTPVVFRQYSRKNRNMEYWTPNPANGTMVKSTYTVKGPYKGVVEAVYQDGFVSFGWTVLHKNDTWDRGICNKILAARQATFKFNADTLDHNVLGDILPENEGLYNAYCDIVDRVIKYHKAATETLTSDQVESRSREIFGRNNHEDTLV